MSFSKCTNNNESIDLKIKKYMELKNNIDNLKIKPTPFKI